MSNPLDRFADRRRHRLEHEIIGVYQQAQKEIAKKLSAWQKRYAKKSAEMLQQVESGAISMQTYKDWLAGQVFIGRNWSNKLEEVGGVLVEADKAAARITNRETTAVFVEGANYAAYEIERDIGGIVNFSLFDETKVGRLIRDKPELMPRRVINGERDAAWQTHNVANAVTQGIVQGEGIPEITKRIARDTGTAAGNATTRYARTAMTAAQNAGRQERMEEAEDELEEFGIEVKKMWVATLDSRTRDAHQELDGVTVGVDESFHNEIGEIKFPGDPSADDANVWNCRCTLEYVYPKYPRERQRRAYREYVDENGRERRESYIVGDLTYSEWKEAKQNEGHR